MPASFYRCVFLVCVIVFAGIARAEDYKIRMSLPAHVGERADARYVATLAVHSVMNYEDRETKTDEAQRVELDAIEDVRQIDSNQRPTQISLEIKRCVEVLKDGSHRTILSPGRTLLATTKKHDEAELTLDRGKLTRQDEALLRLIVHLREREEPSDDEIFGTEARQAIGSSWPINSKAFARQPSQPGFDPVRPKNISGTTTLVAVHEVPGFGPCLQLELNFTIRKMTGIVGEYKLVDGTYQSITAMMMPIEDGKDSPAESWANQYHQVYAGTYDGNPVRVERDTTRTIEGHRTMLSSKPAITTQPATVPSTRPAPKPLAKRPAATTAPSTTSHVR
jgi:hypothetical protein